LLDEPTAGIDVVAKAELMRLVRVAVDEGRAAIVVSSELDELSGFCDRIYIMRDGRITHVVPGDTTVVALARLCAGSPQGEAA
jgi:ABC-type sugar transport system ATPase subunit